MYTPSARRGAILLVVILLLISVLLEQAIAGIFPLLSQAGGVRPMIVFLDIPLETPVKIDWLPVGFIFMIFYSMVVVHRGPGGLEGAGDSSGFGRGWAVLGRWWLLLILMLTGGGIYSIASGFLPKEVRKGIESFGMRADLTLPYPSGETIHLQGSMIMLVFFILGWRLLIKKALPPMAAKPVEVTKREDPRPAGTSKPEVRRPVPETPKVTLPKPVIAAAPPPVPAEATVPARGRISMRVPEPVEVKVPAGRSCVYVSMPAGFQRKRSSYPCVVEDGIRPSMHRHEVVS